MCVVGVHCPLPGVVLVCMLLTAFRKMCGCAYKFVYVGSSIRSFASLWKISIENIGHPKSGISQSNAKPSSWSQYHIISTRLMRHKILLDNSNHSGPARRHLFVVASHNCFPFSNWNSVVIWKSEWMWAQSPTWRKPATWTSFVNIRLETVYPASEISSSLAKSENDKTLLDISDVIDSASCVFLDNLGRFVRPCRLLIMGRALSPL